MDFTRGTGYLVDEDRPDDNPYKAALSSASIPSKVDLLAKFPSSWRSRTEDQGYTSSCVGQAAGTLIEFLHQRQTGRFAEFSHSMCYWNARKMRNWTDRDEGSYIRDCFSSLGVHGVCLEAFHPFWNELGLDVSASSVFQAPDKHAVAQAKRHKLVNPRRLDRGQVFDALASDRPVVFGFKVYQHAVFSEEVRKTGIIPSPKKSSDPKGGHAVVIAGYDQSRGVIWGPNSWGHDTWGYRNSRKQGWYEMDMDYVFNSQISSDFWTADYIEE